MSVPPSYISALWHVARLLGVSGKDMGSHNRQTINRAIKGRLISDKFSIKVRQAMEHALLERLRKHRIAPPGVATSVLDEIAVYCLRHYEYLHQHLQVRAENMDHVHWVLIREIWAPTIYLTFLKHARQGLGNEFISPDDWYLPKKIDQDQRSSVSVLLDRWLRTAGLRTAYGITKSSIKKSTEKQTNAWAAEKKKLERWLNGQTTPTLKDLYRLIDDYPREVAWLDSADSWRSRFFLAHTLAGACESAQKVLIEKFRKPRNRVAQVFADLHHEHFYADDAGILSDSATFFAVRLWIKHIKTTGDFDRMIGAIPQNLSRQYGPEVSDEEITQMTREDEWQSKPGNHIATYLLKSAGADGAVSNAHEQIERNEKIETYLRNFAVGEINRLIEEETKTARERLVPRRKPKPSKRAQSSS